MRHSCVNVALLVLPAGGSLWFVSGFCGLLSHGHGIPVLLEATGHGGYHWVNWGTALGPRRKLF